MKAPPSDPEFDLFISYVRRDSRRLVGGHSVDVVAELKRELESHRRLKGAPGHQRRFRVCTDLDDFALDGTFEEIMRERISRSRAFLLVCSNGVAESRFVQKELEICRSLQSYKPLAAVLSASAVDVAPELFAPNDVAADLATPDGVTRREFRALLRRESHKIVARVWRLTPREVYDRFEADRRAGRRRVVYAAATFLVLTSILVVALGGETGFHRVTILPIRDKLVSPAGVGFAKDGRTPIVLNGENAWIWSSGLDHVPNAVHLPFSALHAVAVKPGELSIADLTDAAKLSVPGMEIQIRTTVQGRVEGLAATADEMFVSDEDGALFIVDKNGRTTSAPRPISVAGRRFKAFRERGPFQFGSILAVSGEHYLASTTLSGHLGLLDLRKHSFIVPPEPQFPLAAPVDVRDDPILYETENTRPIGALTFLSDSSLLFSEGTGLNRVDTATGRVTALTHCPIELIRQLIPLRDGRTLIALTSSTLEVLRFSSDDPTRLECKQRTTLAPKFGPQAAIASDGTTILIAFFDGEPELWRPTFRLFGFDLPLPR